MTWKFTVDSDFNTTALTIKRPATFDRPLTFSPGSAVIDDRIPELSEGFIYYLEVDRANTDRRDLERIQYMNRHILVTIKDDDGMLEWHVTVVELCMLL